MFEDQGQSYQIPGCNVSGGAEIIPKTTIDRDEPNKTPQNTGKTFQNLKSYHFILKFNMTAPPTPRCIIHLNKQK